MAAKIECKGCDGEGEVEATIGLYANGGYIVSREPCEDCGGSGFAPCVNCGADSNVELFGATYCTECAEDEVSIDDKLEALAEVRA